MNTATRRSALLTGNGQRDELRSGESAGRVVAPEDAGCTRTSGGAEQRVRVHIAAGNRLLREALSRILLTRGDIDVAGLHCAEPFRVEGLIEEKPDILLLTSRGNLAEDVEVIRQVRLTAPEVRILLVGKSKEETEFLQYVRAGIKGYVPLDASMEELVEALRAVQAGKAVCPGSLCTALFQFFESEATSIHSGTIQPRLGLTRREQQIVPLIAQGLTNKEIANKFCLSEQTVKNHLYRMKHKVGAGDRFGIVHLCRTQGFLV